MKEYNARQREAIERGNGPVLTVSGAGTGKTRLITGRILYLILEKGVAPENILALTFTEKAAQEMVERVDCGLPLGYGEIWIKTFHAFCDSVLRESAFEIGLSVDYKLLGEADSWMFLKRHVLDFKLEYYRSLGNPQKFLAAMQQHFSRLKDEDITPEQYVEYAGRFLKSAETDEDRENALKQAELANAYQIYDRILAENNCMDFGGLLTNTLRLFERRPSVSKHYRDRFKYILVDEFQDTNFAQNKIVTLLAQEHKNLLVVGDDDQSIYKWRGASLTNIRYFEKLFPEAKKIVLNENYRSSQAILDLSWRVIQKNNPNRLEIEQNVDKRLVSAVKCKQNIPEIHHFETLDREVEFVVSQAKKAVKSGKDTAILVRTNALAEPFLAELKRAAFPFQHFSSQALFAKAGVKDCIAVLRVIADPWDDLAMFRLLSMPFFKIKMQDVLELMRKAKASGRSLFNLLESGKCGVIKKLLAELIEFSREHCVSEVLGKFFNESGYLQEVTKAVLKSDALNAAEHQGLLEDIAAFSEKIKEFEAVHPDKQVADFMAYAQMIEDIGERGGVNKDLDPSAIKILTIHSAKGLEFDCVFMPGLVQGKFPSINRRDPFEIPRELVQEALPEGDCHVEEERRLFYVGLTRARESLFLTYSDFYDGKKKWKQSLFVAEALESGKAVMKNVGKMLKMHKDQIELPLAQTGCNPVCARKHRPLQFVLPRLSYSQLDAFRTCPMKYQFRYLFQIPVPMPAVVNFGSSMHNTLRDFYAELQKHPERAGEDLMPFLKEIYEKNWISYGYETRELQKDQKARGLLLLKRFYEKERAGFSAAPAFLEKRFVLKIGDVSVKPSRGEAKQLTRPKGATISGQIDRIDRLPDGTFEVIDYKTGGQAAAKRRPHTSAHLLKQDIDNNLQLSIYALACRDVLKLPISRLSLYYLEECEKVSTARTDKQLDACAKEILECAEEISQSDFSPAPGFHCGYCDYRLVCTEAKIAKK